MTDQVPADPFEMIKIFAHRGFSSRRPEMTWAAYREAISFAASVTEQEIEFGLECDVHFAADDRLICLHDLDLDRTAEQSGAAFDQTSAELAEIDFGHWGRWAAQADRVPGDSQLIMLDELFGLVAEARDQGVELGVNVETKHPNPRGFAVDERVAELVAGRGWQHAPSPVRVISFAPASLARLGLLLPGLRRTYLVERTLAPVLDGRLPDGIDVVGPDLRLIRDDPDFVARARSHGNEVHVWTVNEIADIEFCLDLGVTGFTTDFPDRVLDVLGSR